MFGARNLFAVSRTISSINQGIFCTSATLVTAALPTMSHALPTAAQESLQEGVSPVAAKGGDGVGPDAGAVVRSLSSVLTTIPLTRALVPPGKCQFSSELTSVPLLERVAASPTSSLLRFGLPDSNAPLNLSTCACVLAKAALSKDGGSDAEKEDVIRPYTPISTNDQIGSFDLLVKHYDGGLMSTHMKNLPVGSTLDFKHIDKNVKIQAPFGKKHIGMLVGGTGITPMIQALHAILGTDGAASSEKEQQETVVSMLYGSKEKSDILGREVLDRWSAEAGEHRFRVTHVLSHEPSDSDWDGERGFINRNLVEKWMPRHELGDDVLIFVCGPPPMYDALCGPRDEKKLTGLLADLGYKEEQVYKF